MGGNYEVTKIISKIITQRTKVENKIIALEDKRDVSPLSASESEDLAYNQGIYEGYKLALDYLDHFERTGKCK